MIVPTFCIYCTKSFKYEKRLARHIRICPQNTVDSPKRTSDWMINKRTKSPPMSKSQIWQFYFKTKQKVASLYKMLDNRRLGIPIQPNYQSSNRKLRRRKVPLITAIYRQQSIPCSEEEEIEIVSPPRKRLKSSPRKRRVAYKQRNRIKTEEIKEEVVDGTYLGPSGSLVKLEENAEVDDQVMSPITEQIKEEEEEVVDEACLGPRGSLVKLERVEVDERAISPPIPDIPEPSILLIPKAEPPSPDELRSDTPPPTSKSQAHVTPTVNTQVYLVPVIGASGEDEEDLVWGDDDSDGSQMDLSVPVDDDANGQKMDSSLPGVTDGSVIKQESPSPAANDAADSKVDIPVPQVAISTKPTIPIVILDDDDDLIWEESGQNSIPGAPAPTAVTFIQIDDDSQM
ncbi:hypothetical protein HDE_00242 [Halotydeus destructor]|nr:hypothetical protein HDE_00242 [Halotydeus destructor]